jgi:hypothetical protein
MHRTGTWPETSLAKLAYISLDSVDRTIRHHVFGTAERASRFRKNPFLNFAESCDGLHCRILRTIFINQVDNLILPLFIRD